MVQSTTIVVVLVPAAATSAAEAVVVAVLFANGYFFVFVLNESMLSVFTFSGKETGHATLDTISPVVDIDFPHY